ncbi:predicted protein [Thalassiosira pseudonana CCMP1335]|uniref:EF-hand domain-containing protein n=1 Tax=Thalassiosira pseudonana TaxID=35128 RepID=B5YND2_THAPS|nr:predicted protein [Thalassiosira pseudonana CCMP1335]ACI64610.1 predicted protein [Thalassiosira pseudonana CCMP1335]
MEQMMRDKLQQRTKTGPFQLRKTFKYFDRDGSGGIDFDEFQRAMELMGFQFTDIQQLALFARYDESCSGEVDYSEFVEKVMENDFKGVKKLFGIVDNDGSNYIDRSEMATLLNNLGKSLSEEEIDEGFVKLDTDSSGQIDFEEFYSWYKDVAFGNKSD